MGGIDDALLPGFSINIRGRRRIGHRSQTWHDFPSPFNL